MTKVLLEIFSQPTSHTLKIIAGWMLASLGSNWIRCGNLSLQYKKILGAHSICKASDAEHVKSLVGSIFGIMELDLILVGRAVECSNQI